MSRRILITPRSLTRSPPPGLDRLTRAGFDLVMPPPGAMPDEATLLRLVPGCEGWLAGVEPVSDRVIAAADRLRVIARNGTGVDSLPLPVLTARGIALRRAEGANAGGVAELTLGLIIAALRHLPATAAGVRAGGWPRHTGREISGATAGVIGCGAIGRRVIAALQGLGARVVAHDPFRPDLGPAAVPYLDLDDLLARADIVTLHCPAGPRPLLDRPALARLPAGAVIVNTARPSLVDEAALLAALDGGGLAAYATDVFDPEPPGDSALTRHPGVIATSHIGGLTRESIARATDMAVDHLLEVLQPAAAP